MDIKKIEIIHSRAEDLAHQEIYREKFDVATTRAVSNLTTILEYMLPFIKIGGKAICMKGPNYEDELKDALNRMEITNLEYENAYEEAEQLMNKLKNNKLWL